MIKYCIGYVNKKMYFDQKQAETRLNKYHNKCYSTKKTRRAVKELSGKILFYSVQFKYHYISHFSLQFIVVLNLPFSVLNQEVDFFLPASS